MSDTIKMIDETSSIHHFYTSVFVNSNHKVAGAIDEKFHISSNITLGYRVHVGSPTHGAWRRPRGAAGAPRGVVAVGAGPPTLQLSSAVPRGVAQPPALLRVTESDRER